VEKTFTCNLCDALCGLRVEVQGSRVRSIRGDPEDVLSRGHVCPKAHALGELLEDPDRVRTPLVRDSSGALRPASWDEALDRAVSGLAAVREKHGKDAVALYVGNPVVHAHRSSLAAQLLTLAIGTKNRFDPNSQDSNPRLFACMQVYGDALSMPVPDVDRTRHLLMLGANPAASNGSQMALGNPKERIAGIVARGGRVVLIDPRRSETATWCSSHHFVRPGGDAALLFAILHVLFAEGRIEERKLRYVANGVSRLRALAARFPPSRVADAIGMDASTIASIARDFASADGACAYSRVGVCQNAFGPMACWLTEALNVVTGNLDRVGGVMFSTPAADVAPLGRLLVGNHWGRFRSRVRGLPELFGAIPSAAMSEEIETEGDGRVRAMVILAGNPVLSTPNGARLDRAMQKLEHVVAIDFYVNETTQHAHVILPPKHVFETGNFDLILGRFAVRNVVKYSPPILDAGEETRDDWEIAVELALRLVGPPFDPLLRLGRRALRSLPERVIDLLLRTGPRRLTLAKLRDAPHGLDFGPLVPSRSLRDHVRTDDGLVQLAPEVLVADVPRLERWIDEARDSLVLIGRRHVRSNNSWMHNVKSLAKGPDRARLLLHPDDAARRSIDDGARVRVRSRTGTIEAIVTITDEVMPGVVSLPHGFGHGERKDTMRLAGALPGANVNAITDELAIEPILGTSILNGVPIEVENVND